MLFIKCLLDEGKIEPSFIIYIFFLWKSVFHMISITQMSFWTPTYLQIRNSQVREYIFISTSRWQKGEKIPLNGKEFSFWAVTATQGLIKRTLCAVFGPQWQRGGSQRAYGSYPEVFEGCQPSRRSARLAQKMGTGNWSKLKFRCSKKNKLHSTIISSQPQSAFPPFLLTSSFFFLKICLFLLEFWLSHSLCSCPPPASPQHTHTL